MDEVIVLNLVKARIDQNFEDSAPLKITSKIKSLVNKKILKCTTSLEFAWSSYLQLSFAEVCTCVVDFALVDGASGAVLIQLTQKLIILKLIRLLLL